MKLLTLLITLLFSASVVAQEDRITVSGFWAGMSASEFESNCIARNYYCHDMNRKSSINEPPNSFEFELEDMQTQVVFYRVDDMNSSVGIIIPCRITNTCSMSLFEVADLLVSENIISSCISPGGYPLCLGDEFENGMLEVMSGPETGNYPAIYIDFSLTPNFN